MVPDGTLRDEWPSNRNYSRDTETSFIRNERTQTIKMARNLHLSSRPTTTKAVARPIRVKATSVGNAGVDPVPV